MQTQASAHPRLDALVARAHALVHAAPPPLGLVYPCDTLALQAGQRITRAGIARPLLIGPRAAIERAADEAAVDVRDFELIDSGAAAIDAARRATALAREGAVSALMKGSLHTDQFMSALIHRTTGLWGRRRVSHMFLFDLARYHKLIALADCVVNIAPKLPAKRDILANAVELLQHLDIVAPKVGIVAAVEAVNPAIQATVDAQALVQMAREGAWPGAIVEGPFGFDNAFSAEAARIKKIESQVAGDADLLLMPDLNAGNMLYKSFIHVAGGDCAGLVLGMRVPIVLTSRADSTLARMASVALAVLAGSH